MSELFDIAMVAVKSPRLKWLEKHNLLTHEFDHEGESPETGRDFGKWVCRDRDFNAVYETFGHGKTEADAIADWARRNGVRLWNEE